MSFLGCTMCGFVGFDALCWGSLDANITSWTRAKMDLVGQESSLAEQEACYRSPASQLNSLPRVPFHHPLCWTMKSGESKDLNLVKVSHFKLGLSLENNWGKNDCAELVPRKQILLQTLLKDGMVRTVREINFLCPFGCAIPKTCQLSRVKSAALTCSSHWIRGVTEPARLQCPWRSERLKSADPLFLLEKHLDNCSVYSMFGKQTWWIGWQI